MADEYSYWDVVTGIRAQLGSEDDWVRGNTLISAETCSDISVGSFGGWISEHFPLFLRLIRDLSPNEQDALLSSYLLNATQTRIGAMLGKTQTIISSLQRRAVGKIAFQAAWLPLGRIRELLGGVDMPESVSEPLIEAMQHGMTPETRKLLGKHPIRRILYSSAEQLDSSEYREAKMVANWIYGLRDIFGGSSYDRETVRVTDPEVCGQFRIPVGDVGKLFAARGMLDSDRETD